MVFPSTQVEFKAERLPWLSAGLVVVSLWVLLAIPSLPSSSERDPKTALEAAFGYWQTHGYLNPDDRTLDAARSHFDGATHGLALAVIRELGRRGMPEATSQQRAEQEMLDGLALAAGPERRSGNPLSPAHALRVYGFTPASPSFLGAGTYPFLYAGWIHFFAIVPLWFFLGASAEERWGWRGIALFTLLATLVSAATHLLLEPNSPMSLIGAAGPTAALLAVFCLRYRREPVRVVAVSPWKSNGALQLVPFALPALAIPVCWIVVNLSLIFWLDTVGARNDLSISALIGGLGFGLLAGVALQRLGIETPYLGPELEDKIRSSAEAPAMDEARVARDMGDVDRAYEVLRSEAERNPDNQEVTRLLWELAIATGQTSESASTLALQIRRLIRQSELADAVDLWCELVEELPNHRLPPDDLVRIVPLLLSSERGEFAVAALRQCADAPPGELSLGTALQLFDFAEGLDPFTALLAARRVLELPELHESKRTRILALIRELDPHNATYSEPVAPDEIEQATADTEKPLVPGPDLSSLPRFEGIQPVAAVPTRLTDEVLYFQLEDGRKARVAYTQIQALAVAALRDVSHRPVVVIDLLLNWTEMSSTPLRSIRLRSDQFDPANLVSPSGSPTENLRVFLAELQDRSRALPLPDADAVRGRPFRAFKFLRTYQRKVLKVDC